MISDTLFEAAREIDRYLSDRGTTSAYAGDLRARIVNLRAEMDAIRAVLDTPPTEGDDDAS